MGGGFGYKLEHRQAHGDRGAAVAEDRRPVKLFLTREETFLAAGNRPADRMTREGGREEGRHADRAAV